MKKLLKTLKYHAIKRASTIAVVVLLCIVLVPGILLCARAGSQGQVKKTSSGYQADSLRYISGVTLKISTGGKTMEASLLENPTTREFMKRLPMKLAMGDIHRREKYAGIDRALPANVQVVKRYAIGDVSYWLGGGIAIYYDQDGKEISAGLVHLAKIQKGVEAFNHEGR
ncbi:MAG: hypothetical protein EOP49_26740, partial [Sphingobacteriales bacterium]